MRKITGGERVGNNLFHCFEEFSIPEGRETIFENAAEIENIFILITGNEDSLIDGLLQNTGGANFFLVNPNGIVFGENARLEVGGSFIATTADRFEFTDDKTFSTKENQKSILTGNRPIGLGLDGNNGSITVNGRENQITNKSLLSSIEFNQRPAGLFVNNGQTLALVGNGLDFHGGVITTEGGNIYLTSLESGLVRMSQAENGLTFFDDDVTKYQNINLNQQSLVYSSGKKVGNISLIGKNINITDASFVLAQNQSNSSCGSIHVKAFEILTLSGRSQSSNPNLRSAIRSETLNFGAGSNINIAANQLILQDSARIRTYSFGEGEGGNIEIKIFDLIKLFPPSSIIATTYGKGNAGNIDLSASQLQSNLGGIASSTLGTGDGGRIDINVDLIEISGNSSGNRGNIAATSFAMGNAGSVTINTSQLQILEGASLSSSGFASGNAGNITINASESVELVGANRISPGGNNPQSTIRSAVQSVSSGGRKAYQLPAVPTGNSGSLKINTPLLRVSQEAVISVENQGTGKAGKLKINADTLNLDEAGWITAASESGKGGDIFIAAQNLQTGSNSKITAVGLENSGKVTIEANNLTTQDF